MPKCAMPKCATPKCSTPKCPSRQSVLLCSYVKVVICQSITHAKVVPRQSVQITLICQSGFTPKLLLRQNVRVKVFHAKVVYAKMSVSRSNIFFFQTGCMTFGATKNISLLVPTNLIKKLGLILLWYVSQAFVSSFEILYLPASSHLQYEQIGFSLDQRNSWIYFWLL